MICPKCGFSQLDDLYCANCGVDVEKYVQKNKKKRYFEGIIIVCMCIGAFYFAYYLHNTLSSGKKSAPDKDVTFIRKAQVEKKAISSPKLYQKKRKNQRSSPKIKKPRKPQATVKSDISPKKSEKSVPLDQPSEISPPPEKISAETKSPPETVDSEPTAEQWFEKGKELDDDSDLEINYYKKTIALDDKFAPAYFRMGSIYFRRAEYDSADKEFMAFLRHASESERQIYDVYEYYSLAEVEALLQEKETTETEIESSDNKEESEEKGKSEQKLAEEKASESSEELKTVVNYTTVRGHIKVPVLLNESVRAKMLLDTGAGVTIISKKLARKMGLNTNKAESIRLKTIAQDLRVPLVELESIYFGNMVKRDFQVAISDLNLGEKSFDGILGMDFLGDYDIAIDSENNKIVLSAN